VSRKGVPHGPDAHTPYRSHRGSGRGPAGGHDVGRARYQHGSLRSHGPGACQVLRPGPRDRPVGEPAGGKALHQAATDTNAVFSTPGRVPTLPRLPLPPAQARQHRQRRPPASPAAAATATPTAPATPATTSPAATSPAASRTATPAVTGSTPGHPGAPAAVTQTAPSLCIQVTPAQASSQAGQAADWTVTVWATGGNVPSAAVRLTASPAGRAAPRFSFGCGNSDGTAACTLGTVDPDSAPRQLQAQLTIPASATSVTLTATASAPGVNQPPQADAPVTVPSPPATTDTPPPPATLPSLSAMPPVPSPTMTPSPALSPAGNAASLFPTLSPATATTPADPPAAQAARPIADTTALAAAFNPVRVQVAGLAALALAFLAAAVRLCIRRPAPEHPDTTGTGTSPGLAARRPVRCQPGTPCNLRRTGIGQLNQARFPSRGRLTDRPARGSDPEDPADADMGR
jgi:hypothetical protein